MDLIYSSCPVADLNMSEHQVREVAECLLLAGLEIGFPRLNTAAVAQLLTDLEPGAAYHPLTMERLRAQIIASTKLSEGSL